MAHFTISRIKHTPYGAFHCCHRASYHILFHAVLLLAALTLVALWPDDPYPR